MKDLDVSHPLKRFCAAAIDMTLLGTISEITLYFLRSYYPPEDYTGSLKELLDAQSAVMFPLFVLYFVLMEWAPWGATFGKLALGIRVVLDKPMGLRDDDKPRRPPLWRVAVRNAAKIFVLPTFTLSFLIAFMTPRRQTLHDMFSGTTVITERYQF